MSAATWSELLKSREQERTLTPKQMARALDVDQAKYYRWRNDEGGVDLKDIEDLAVKLNVSEEEILWAVYQTMPSAPTATS